MLSPHVRAGEPVRIGQYEVVDWRYVDGETTVQGSAAVVERP
ncbi:MAG: hypothetical protein WD069_00940 [Planctomycetales bacterium]